MSASQKSAAQVGRVDKHLGPLGTTDMCRAGRDGLAMSSPVCPPVCQPASLFGRGQGPEDGLYAAKKTLTSFSARNHSWQERRVPSP